MKGKRELAGARLKILVIGGYGVFGSRFVELLKDEPRLKFIVAGRSISRARAQCSMEARAELVPAEFDRDGEVEAQVRYLEPHLVVDASGPFQAYGVDPYRVVRAALAVGAHYIDIADGREFVIGITEFDQSAKASQRFVLSGLSTCPALTCAAVRALAREVTLVERIAAGIAPSPQVALGYSVIRGVLDYAGKPVRIVRNGQQTTAPGLVDSREYTITQPGNVPLFRRRFSLVDVPDLQVLAAQWPTAGEVWFGVGTEPAWLHWILNGFAGLVHRRVLPTLKWFAPVVNRISNLARGGEHRGGMFVRVYGRDGAGGLCRRRWHLIAPGDNGPFIPAMAAAAVVRRCLAGTPPEAGARIASNELELEDFEPLFAARNITAMRFGDVPADRDRPIYHRVLQHRFDSLAAPIRELHDLHGKSVFRGRGRVERGDNPLARLAATIMRFPRPATDVPVEVELREDKRVETWVRRFGGKEFQSVQEFGRGRYDGLIVERFGPMSFGLALVEEDGNLYYLVRRWDIFGVAMPRWALPEVVAFEHTARERFNFSVRVSLPLIGLVIAYRGWLKKVA